jgi:hypothetical protein
MFTPIAEMPRGAIGVSASGRVTAEDRRTVLEPAIASALAAGGKLKLLYVAGPDFTGYEDETPWDEAVFGTRHFFDFERIAFVADEGLHPVAVRALAGIMPAELRVFGTGEIEAAKGWLGA